LNINKVGLFNKRIGLV